jgi:uncharacterized YigZ family protein
MTGSRSPSPFEYLSPEGRGEAELKEQGSRFLAFLGPARTPQEALDFLEQIKRRFHDATHHCWAYRLGWGESLRERASDAGEPARTAGPPILSALQERQVSDACLVVVRYFGGVKLGTGGLARAYRSAARSALSCATLASRELAAAWEVTLPYSAQGGLRRTCARNGVQWMKEAYGESLRVDLQVPLRSAEAFEADLRELKEAWKGEVLWKSK